MTPSTGNVPVKKKVLPFYPILFAVYPVIFLFTVNRQEVIFRQLLLPLLSSLFLVSVLWFLIRIWKRDLQNSAFSVTLLITLFFLYGRIYEALEPLNHLSKVSFIRHLTLVPLMLGLWLAVSIFFVPRKTAQVTRVLNVIGIFMVGLNLVVLGVFAVKKSIASRQQVLEEKIPAGLKSPENLRDIYYIVLDGFPSEKTLEELYHYRDSEFYRFLEQKGFHICPGSETSSKLTLQVMAARFNCRNLKREDDPAALIRRGPVISRFKEMGYAVHTFPVYFNIHFEQADFVHHYILDKNQTLMNDFHMICLKTTMFRFIHDSFIRGNRYRMIARNIVLHVYKKIQKMIDAPGPKFVHAHVFAPHAPFVFDREGGAVSYKNFYNFREKRYYLDQTLYIAKRTQEMIEAILNRSKVPPVIILQSDHGPRGDDMRLPERAHRNPDEIRVLDVGEHWKYILNAFYLPGKGLTETDMDPAFNPLNTFPFIFKLYFDNPVPDST